MPINSIKIYIFICFIQYFDQPINWWIVDMFFLASSNFGCYKFKKNPKKSIRKVFMATAYDLANIFCVGVECARVHYPKKKNQIQVLHLWLLLLLKWKTKLISENSIVPIFIYSLQNIVVCIFLETCQIVVIWPKLNI